MDLGSDPQHPFTLATSGLSRKALRYRVAKGLIKAVAPGVFLGANVELTPEFRAIALQLVVPIHTVVSLHGELAVRRAGAELGGR